MAGPLPQQHGLGQASFLTDLEVVPLGHLGYGVLSEKFPSYRCLLGFFRNSFDAVLTVFSQFGTFILRVRPGAARAVDAALLVEAEHDLCRIPGGYVFPDVSQCGKHTGYSCSPVLSFGDSDAGEAFGGLGAAVFFLKLFFCCGIGSLVH